MNNITSYYGDLGIFLYYTPIVSAFMAAFALLANRRRTPSQTWLALVLVTFGTGMAASFLFDRYFSASHSEIFRPVNFIFSTANSIVILFYYVSLMRPQLLTRKYMLYFSGGWALFSLFVLLPGTFSARFQPVQGIHRLADLSSLPMVFHLLTICCILVFYTWMGVFILRIYRDYRKFIVNSYSFVGGITLSWVSITIYLFIIMGILDILWMVNTSAGYKMLFNVVSLGAVWTLFWYGSRQSAIPPVDIEPKKKSFKEVEELSVTTDDKQAKLKIQFLEYFNHKKPYLNPELSLKEVAQALQTNHYALSRFINKEFEVNFYTLINRFRVEYILHLIELNKGTINCDTLHAISGFKSRTTFFKQFKEIAGCTPQEYIESRKTEKSDNSTIKTKLF